MGGRERKRETLPTANRVSIVNFKHLINRNKLLTTTNEHSNLNTFLSCSYIVLVIVSLHYPSFFLLFSLLSYLQCVHLFNYQSSLSTFKQQIIGFIDIITTHNKPKNYLHILLFVLFPFSFFFLLSPNFQFIVQLEFH